VPIGPSSGGVVQLAASSPITTPLPASFDLADLPNQELLEVNGWPNLGGRLNLGFGPYAERAGGRRLRPLERGGRYPELWNRQAQRRISSLPA